MTGVWRIKVTTRQKRVRRIDRQSHFEYLDEAFDENDILMEGIEVAGVVNALVSRVNSGAVIRIICDLEE